MQHIGFVRRNNSGDVRGCPEILTIAAFSFSPEEAAIPAQFCCRAASGHQFRQRADIARLRADEPAGELLLARMRDPAADAAGGKDVGERLLGKAGRLEIGRAHV